MQRIIYCTSNLYIEKVSVINPSAPSLHTDIETLCQMHCSSLVNSPPDLWEGHVGDDEKYGVGGFTILPTLPHPRSRGSITLASGDPNDEPVIDPNYFSDEHDVKIMVDALKFSFKFAETQAFKEQGIRAAKPAKNGLCTAPAHSDEYYSCFVQQHFRSRVSQCVVLYHVGLAGLSQNTLA
jgi:hypothetical protein